MSISKTKQASGIPCYGIVSFSRLKRYGTPKGSLVVYLFFSIHLEKKTGPFATR